jgi:hypothetical protein
MENRIMQKMEDAVMRKSWCLFGVIVVAMGLLIVMEGCSQNVQSESSATVTATAPTPQESSVENTCTTQECRTDIGEAAAPEEEIMVESEERSSMTRQFDRMAYNAELGDMSLSDIHFLPQRSALNSNGEYRLHHLAWFIDRYGGTISLNLKEPESSLAQARLEQVTECLKKQGLPSEKIHISFDLPQSIGLDAKEAVIIYNDTRYKPSAQ